MPQPRRTERCETCRRRKIRCDETRPRCGQCVRGRRRCVEPDVSIIISQWPGSHSTKLKALDPHDACIKYQEANLLRAVPQRPLDGDEGSTEQRDLKQLWEHFLRLQLPFAITDLSADKETASTRSLWQSLTQLDSDSIPLRYALAAVASARIGRIESNHTLYKSAGRLYIRAVSNLREILSDKTQRASINVIAAVLALAAYEFYEDSSSGFGYISHAQGASRLIESLGHQHFTSGIAHDLFLNFRELEIIHSLMGRKATFLSSHEWSTFPWTIHSKSHFDYLLDIGALLSKLTEETYMLNPLSDTTATLQRLELINRYWKVYDKLQKWYISLEELNGGNPLYVICTANGVSNGCTLHSSPKHEEFPGHFHFQDLETARCLLFFWSFMCVVSNGITWENRALRGEGSDYKICRSCSWAVKQPCLCNRKLPALEFMDSKMRQPLGLSYLFAMADNISRSVEYLLQPEMKGAGAEICVFPLRIAYEAYRFRDDQEKLSWVSGFLKELEDLGISWGTSLVCMQFSQYRDQSQRGQMVLEDSPGVSSRSDPDTTEASISIELAELIVV